ncbi:MAG TPA: hypothetical protein VFE47_10460 [Tepidisphaeraceae bacterium]|jgi:hypothetical protein|nr:hypothetical protein [Tepidisphaeraceae bacterium]
MRRSSVSIGLALIGTTLAASGFDAYQVHKSSAHFFGPTTQPWNSTSGNSYHTGFWGGDDFRHHSSSIGRSSSSHSSTSRGGFGSTGHSGGHS